MLFYAKICDDDIPIWYCFDDKLFNLIRLQAKSKLEKVLMTTCKCSIHGQKMQHPLNINLGLKLPVSHMTKQNGKALSKRAHVTMKKTVGEANLKHEQIILRSKTCFFIALPSLIFVI